MFELIIVFFFVSKDKIELLIITLATWLASVCLTWFQGAGGEARDTINDGECLPNPLAVLSLLRL